MALHRAFTLLLTSAAWALHTAAQDTAPARDQPDFTRALLTSDPAPAPVPTPDSLTAAETAVLAAHDAIVAAIEALELDRLETLLLATDRGALIADGRITLARGDMIASLQREFAALRHIRQRFTRRHVSLLASTAALIVTEGTITAQTDDGATIIRPFAQTLVFVRVDDVWRLAHLHSSAPPAALGDH